MPSLLARSLVVLGSVLLIHAAYSAHEHTHLLTSLHGLDNTGGADGKSGVSGSSTSSSSSSSSAAAAKPSSFASLSSLPNDITLETLIALALVTVGIVLSSEPLKPIRWSEWAAGVEHDRHGRQSKYITQSRSSSAGATTGSTRDSTEIIGQKIYGGPSVEGFGWLEAGKRMGFFDIKTRRKEFADWVKKGAEKEI